MARSPPQPNPTQYHKASHTRFLTLHIIALYFTQIEILYVCYTQKCWVIDLTDLLPSTKSRMPPLEVLCQIREAIGHQNCSFFNIVQKAFGPPPPFFLNIMW